MKKPKKTRKHVNEMSRKEFDALPYRKSWDKAVKCRSLVILPTRRKHDSGYRAMDFVAAKQDGQPICRVSGCSDVLNIDGIGGYGKWDALTEQLPRHIEPKGWSIDCLPKSGLLRIFCDGEMEVGSALSSLSVYGSRR